ncbi:hypothetical protein SAMN06264364_10313 [Quadrisphaera granulorum]|uniref:Anti-sigma factor RsiW n=1 Tax=Quadrisphaera granulorum TaxID=317664 RepID=A0A316AEM2_9ACTN|nr:hypothetical protein [Quadrisphaera granulorum]PWJ55344.1 hypothetical protein BXY45_10313 [Quadrisphaera granulorum]SZE95408.1 hypothetical protein SAMN06264364_10313 [Quadrisphaera granulorum]
MKLTRHPAEGVLRRLIDEPAGVSDPDRDHIAACGRCQQMLAAVRDDAAAASALLSVPSTAEGQDDDVDAAWQRLRGSTAASVPAASAAADGARVVALDAHRVSDEHVSTARSTRRLTGRGAWRRPGVVALGVAVVVAGAGTAAASDWLRIFQVQQVAPISLSQADLAGLGQLPDPSAFGEAVATKPVEIREVSDAAAAAQATGLQVPRVAELPRGVTGQPTYQVGYAGQVSFTFSAAKAAASAEAAGGQLPPVPAGLDGSVVRLSAGPGVAAVWESSAGVPALIVGRAVAPTAESTGVPFTQVRDYLLSLPGIPADLASQLATFTGDGSTLPLPVPADQAATSTADVNGAPATVVRSNDGTMAGVVWVRNGVVTAVAGTPSTDELLDVARGLK